MAKRTTENDSAQSEAEDSPELIQATRKRIFSKPGFHRKAIQIHDDAWSKILAHIDANDLDLDKWLTKQMSKIADGLS